MHKTMIYLTEDQRIALTRYARRRGQPVAAVIREAVDRLLVRVESPGRPRLLGIAAGGEKGPISERVEEVLAAHLRERAAG